MSTLPSPTVADPALEPAQNAVQSPPIDGVEVVEEYDSAYGDSNANSTASISSSICSYRKVHGRTFHNHGDTEYWGPNDEAANDFLDIGHHMFTLLLGNKLHLAPLKRDVQTVLDIGTGTGIWAMDFADEHPSAAVIGNDLSPTQPGWVPPNLKFEICDIQLDWTYPADSLDFIHLRTMGGSIDNWPLLYSRAFAATKAGGWFEQIDTDIQICCDDGSVKEDSVLFEWSRLFIGAGEKMGRTFTIIRDAKRLLEEAGFVDVVEVPYKLPIGPWGKDPKDIELGRWYLLYITTGLESMALYMLTNVLGWEYADVQVFLEKMRTAIKNPNLHSYTNHTVVYGRKPEAA